MSNTLRKAALPVVVLAVAFGGAAYMMANRVTPERMEVVETSVPVEVQEIHHTTEQVLVAAQGTVTPALEVKVRPEVSGRIVERSSRLVPGGRFHKGEIIAGIDERDYRVNITRQQEVEARAELALRQERARKAVAEDEWELLEDSIPADQENRDLALRIPQIEQAEATVAGARAALAKAELDLERCTIRAPFNALVIRENVDIGQVVNPQTEVATIVGTDYYWVQVSLPVEDLAWIEIPAEGGQRGSRARIVHRSGALEIIREGHVVRLLGDVDPAGRLARLLIVIEDPMNLARGGPATEVPLLIGSYVTVEIAGRSIDDVVVIPRHALREVNNGGPTGTREGLWIMDDDDRLSTREAEVVWRTAHTVLVMNGFADGERLVTSNISTPIEGMKLEQASPRSNDS